MDELKTNEGELTTADLASHGIAQEQPKGPKLVKGQEPEALNRAAAVSEPMPLFSESEMEDFRSQWSNLQNGFVDEPRPRLVHEAILQVDPLRSEIFHLRFREQGHGLRDCSRAIQNFRLLALHQLR